MTNLGNKEIMAKNLRFYVEKSGKTQKEMCDILDVSTSTFNDWMNARSYPRIDKIEILANYFRILKSDLIEDKTVEHREMQEKNDTITDAVVRMRSDDEFFSVVGDLLSLDAERLSAVKNLLSVLK